MKILIAEDNSHLARTLINKLELFENIYIKGWEPNGRALLEHLEQDHIVDIVLMDINMPVMDGIECTRKLKVLYPNIKVVMSTVFDEEQYILQAILAGANGYLLKDERPQKLYDSIVEVLRGGAPMSPAIARKALQLIRFPPPLNSLTAKDSVDFNLTKREIEILEQLSGGLNYSQIADNLIISTGTVRKHIENIYKKLQVHNKVEAVQVALKNRLI